MLSRLLAVRFGPGAKIDKSMKLRRKIPVIIFAMLASLYISAYIFMFVRGRGLILAKLEGLTGKKATAGFFAITPPFNLTIKNLKVDGLASIESVLVSPSVSSLVTGKLAFNKIKFVRPQITYERGVAASAAAAEGAQAVPASAKAPEKAVVEIGAVPEVTLKPEESRPLNIVVKRLRIKDGVINFVDHSVGPEGIRITVKDLNFKLANVRTFFFDDVTNFELEGRIPWRQGMEEGKIEGKGWLNFSKKDMQAFFKVADIDGIYLYPYYSMWVDLEKARIESTKLSFSSDIQGLNNNVTASCHLELSDIVRTPRPSEVPPEKAEKLTDALLGMFKSMDAGKVVLDFTIRTKMDKPRFAFANVKSAFENKIALAQAGTFRPEGVFFLPGKVLAGTVKGATGFSKALIDGTFTLGKEIKNGVADSFRRDAPKNKEEGPVFVAGDDSKK